jgi:hypothetical protein
MKTTVVHCTRALRHSVANVLEIAQLPLLLFIALLTGVIKYIKRPAKHAVALGGCGIINLAGWSKAIRMAGFETQTIVWATPKLYAKDTFDVDLKKRYGSFAGLFAPFEFAKSLFKFHTVICGFDGFILGITPIRSVEMSLLRIARCKVIAIPYGGDAYVYSSVRSEALMHALQISYPQAAQSQKVLTRRVSKVVKRADFVISGLMGFDGIGRWDVLTPNPLVIDTELWAPEREKHDSSEMRVFHTPNHRGFKGTEFLIRAVDELRNEGHKISLSLLEGVSNSEVRRLLTSEADVLVDQLIFSGYAMSAVEGLASGVVVIANLEDDRALTPFRRWSFLDECPIVSASPETIKETLVKLSSDVQARLEISRKSREYVLRRHSFESFASLFVEIDLFLQGKRGTLINYYHPLKDVLK